MSWELLTMTEGFCDYTVILELCIVQNAVKMGLATQLLKE